MPGTDPAPTKVCNMMSTTPGFLGNSDPNTTRAIEALYTLLSDVEQRLQLVKANLAQTIPGSLPGGFTGNAFPGVVPPTAWGHAQGLPLGFSGSPSSMGGNQGFHAFVPTQNGLVPVYIPAGLIGPGAPGNFRL
ncbi:MAG: hypothetical protein QOE90_2148 [Thermoplasmata archaeon]|jgi:hypothetical protein|nr:hypothetical protein [Thermoplasmata archaeon]